MNNVQRAWVMFLYTQEDLRKIEHAYESTKQLLLQRQKELYAAMEQAREERDNDLFDINF